MYNAFIVILEEDINDEDAEQTISAIKQIKGVLSVEPHDRDINETIAEMRVRTDISKKLFDVLWGK